MLAKTSALPSVFPVQNSRRGSRCAVSIADKLLLMEYAYWNRLTNAEVAARAGVSSHTIGKWKREIQEEKARSANAMDQRMLRLVTPSNPKPAQEQESLPARRRRTKSRTSSNRPSPLNEDERIALLERQRAENLTNNTLAEIAGVHVHTITDWRSRYGYAGKRGRAMDHSDEEKAELLGRIDAGSITTEEAAAIAGTTINGIYSWRQKLRKQSEAAEAPDLRTMKITRSDGAVVEVEVTADEMMRLMSN